MKKMKKTLFFLIGLYLFVVCILLYQSFKPEYDSEFPLCFSIDGGHKCSMFRYVVNLLVDGPLSLVLLVFFITLQSLLFYQENFASLPFYFYVIFVIELFLLFKVFLAAYKHIKKLFFKK